MFRVKLKVMEKNKVGKGAQSLRVLFSSSASFDFDLSRLTETDTSIAASVSEAVSGILSRIKLRNQVTIKNIVKKIITILTIRIHQLIIKYIFQSI